MLLSLSPTLSPTSFPGRVALAWGASPEIFPGFDTIDGYRVSQQEGEVALRQGLAVLVGGLLVGLVAGYD